MDAKSQESRALRGLVFLAMIIVLGAMKVPFIPFVIIGGVGLWAITKIFR